MLPQSRTVFIKRLSQRWLRWLRRAFDQLITHLKGVYVEPLKSTEKADIEALVNYGLPSFMLPRIRRELRIRSMIDSIVALPAMAAYILSTVAILVHYSRQSDASSIPAQLGLLAGNAIAGVLFILIANLWRSAKRAHGGMRQIIRALTICTGELQSVRRLLANDPRDHHWAIAAAKLRSARALLRQKAWELTGNVAALNGRQRRERNWKPAARIGQWLCWASEDLTDLRRIDNAIEVCTDLLVHVLSPRPWLAPSLRWPPRSAALRRPPRSQLLRDSAASIWGRLAVVVSVLTFISGLLYGHR